jgi:hypothetical protein
MSVGHIAREFEESGISTVVIAVEPFLKRLEIMSLPRTLLTDNLIGRVLGSPHDTSYQRKVLEQAIKLLSSADKNGTVEHI